MHKNLVKIAHVVPEICSQTDRHIDRQTYIQTYSSQYFATAPASEIKSREQQFKTAAKWKMSVFWQGWSAEIDQRKI